MVWSISKDLVFVKVWAKYEAHESHFMLPRIQESVREWTLTLQSKLPLWELEVWWTPQFLENDCKGQNPLNWKDLYIIGKLLKRRCIKWACMTHYVKGTPLEWKILNSEAEKKKHFFLFRSLNLAYFVLRLIICIGFQVFYCTPFFRVLFTFPSRYLYTIDHLGILRLRGWSPLVT